MGLKTFVKISNVSNLSDARYCAGMGVDVIGFNLSPNSENRISEEDYKEITDWISGVEYVAEVHEADLSQISEVVKKYPINQIEISDLKLVEKVFSFNKPIIFKAIITNEADISNLKSQLGYLDELVKYLIIKCENPSFYQDLDQLIGFYNGNIQLLKGYNIVAEDTNLVKFPGIEMEATKEERPGFKDYGEIMDVLEAIEEY